MLVNLYVPHLPSPLQPLCVGLPNSRIRHDVLRWRLHAAGLYSQHRGGRVESKPIMFVSGEVGRWQASGHCFPEIQRDTVYLWHPPVPTPPSGSNRWCDNPIEHNPYNPGCYAGHPLHLRPSGPRLCRAGFEPLNVMKALAGSNWGFTAESFVATYKDTILNSAAPIWFTQVSSSHLGKLEVIQSKALRIATGCHQKAAQTRGWGSPLEGAFRTVLSAVLYQRPPTNAPQSSIITSPPDPRPLRAILQTSYHRILRGLRVRSDNPNAPPLSQTLLTWTD